MRISKKLKVLSAAAALAGLTAVGNTKLDLVGNDIPVALQSRDIEVPVYNIFTGLRPGNCSGYVRKAAKELFDVDYSLSSAWDRIYNDGAAVPLTNFKSLETLAEEGKMIPGNLVGVVYPNSQNMDGVDSKRNPRAFSHLLLYLGNSPEDKPLFAHRVTGKTRINSLDHFEPNGYEAKYLISPRTNNGSD